MNKIVEILVDFENFPDEDLGVSIQSVCQALKKQYKSKGWKLEYVE